MFHSSRGLSLCIFITIYLDTYFKNLKVRKLTFFFKNPTCFVRKYLVSCIKFIWFWPDFCIPFPEPSFSKIDFKNSGSQVIVICRLFFLWCISDELLLWSLSIWYKNGQLVDLLRERPPFTYYHSSKNICIRHLSVVYCGYTRPTRW